MKEEFNVLSFFDGKSCGQIALRMADVDVDNYFACEIDKHAIKVTQENFPETKQIGSVVDVNVKNLPKISLLVGGSPCQGFSFAGKQLNFEDPRSKLFFEFVRTLNEIKEANPNVLFLLENVKMKKEFQDIITQHLGVEPIKINSKLVSPVRRDRLYWTNIPNVSMPEEVAFTFDDIDSGNQDWIPADKIAKIANWKAQQKPLKTATLIGAKSKLPCLTARGYNQSHSGMVLITDGEKYRYLTNEEAELAHGLPVGYTSSVSDRERSKMIGNGWDVRVITHIFKNIK